MQKMKVLKALLHQARADALEGNMAAHATRATPASPRSEPFDSPTFAREHTRTPVAFLVDLVHNKKKLLFVRYAMCREAQAE